MAADPCEFKARFSGKLVTVLQFATFVALLRFPQWVHDSALARRPHVGRTRSSTTRTRCGARARVIRRARARSPASFVIALRGSRAAARPAARSPTYAEYRADAIVGRGTAGAGRRRRRSIPLASTCALSVDGAAGATWRDGATLASGRVDAIARFLLDPYREVPIGLSLGGGVSVPYVSGDRARAPVSHGGASTSRDDVRHRVTPAIQIGLGGGTRVGVVLRTSPRRWR